jgi:hypothetical protein
MRLVYATLIGTRRKTMADKSKSQQGGDVERTGEEAELQRSLKDADEKAGDRIADRPYSSDPRERRRGRFIDLYGDEDGDPQTSEATYRRDHGDMSIDSTPPTTSTSSTAPTTSTTSAPRSGTTTGSGRKK